MSSASGPVEHQPTRWWIFTIVNLCVLCRGPSNVHLDHDWVIDAFFAWLLQLGWTTTLITAHRLFPTAFVHEKAGSPQP